MRFSYILLFIYIALIASCLIITNPLWGYIITIIILTNLLQLKTNIVFLFIYFPIRPFITEFNTGLLFLGDAIIVLSFLQVIFIERDRLKTIFLKSHFMVYFYLFLAFGAATAIVSNVPLASIIFQLRTLGIMSLLVYILCSNYWQPKDLSRIVNTSMITALILSLHGIVEKVFSRTYLFPETWSEWELASVNAERVYGMLANPNVLATYLLIVFWLSFLPIQNDSKITRLYPIIRPIILGTTLLTVSRGAFIAFAVGFAIYLVLTRDLKTLQKLTLSAILAFTFIYYPATSNWTSNIHPIESDEHIEESPEQSSQYDSFFQRITTMLSDDTIQASTEWGRIYIVIKGLELFKNSPVLGHGFGTFGDAATLRYGSPIYEQYEIESRIYSDNQYVNILASTGITGIILLIALIVSLLKKLFPIIGHRERATLIMLTIVLLILASFYNILEDQVFMVYYFTILGYLINFNNFKDVS
ncbi:O-antigen ligase [Alkalibacillus filiformis]|uniref:O-antigen ligase n=1 Tax=Alkalibacillus filiformis TaxID=200990 RepID=A0ABU0DWE6_9BACI|nr:O-antigen ligase family protein [Alkalibacillus filiformis]MDQ0352777.1 O-antigen ligase [Alkalibacillus filiformis]